MQCRNTLKLLFSSLYLYQSSFAFYLNIISSILTFNMLHWYSLVSNILLTTSNSTCSLFHCIPIRKLRGGKNIRCSHKAGWLMKVFSLVAEPTTDIIGGPELFIDRGSTINLTCVVLFSPEPPAYIFWNHNDAVSGLTIFSIRLRGMKNALLFLFIVRGIFSSFW